MTQKNNSSVICIGLCLAGTLLTDTAAAQNTSCDDTAIRWASSSNRVYVTGPVRCTLSEIDALVSDRALQLVDPTNRIYLLRANLLLTEGATLVLHGSGAGGDVDELRLLSNNDGNWRSTIYIRAYWGTIDMDSTRVTSWDEAAQGPDLEYETYKRSYIHVRSFLDSDGVTARQSRMDIVNSEVSHLGYAGSEAYGLSWKVLGNTPGLFDKVDVFGDIIDSHIHHNYFGIYTYGARDGIWRNNIVEDNVIYGFDPHDDSDYLTIERNTVRNNGHHGIICSQRCNNLIIRNNNVYNNGKNGIMLHRDVTDSTVDNNVVTGNGDSGIALFDAYNNTVTNNRFDNNKRGIRFSVGSSNNRVENNTFNDNSDYGVYFYQGSDIPNNGGDGRPASNEIVNNEIKNAGRFAIKVRDADNNYFSGNIISGGTGKIELRGSTNTVFDNNDIEDDTQIITKGALSQRGEVYTPGSTTIRGDDRLAVRLEGDAQTTFEDNQGRIFDASESVDWSSIDTGGSRLKLTPGLIGSSTVVTPRDLWITVDSGSLRTRVRLWNDDATLGRKWEVDGESADQRVTFTVGTLVPGQTYRVDKNSALLSTLTADADGRITINDTLGDTGIITYRIE